MPAACGNLNQGVHTKAASLPILAAIFVLFIVTRVVPPSSIVPYFEYIKCAYLNRITMADTSNSEPMEEIESDASENLPTALLPVVMSLTDNPRSFKGIPSKSSAKLIDELLVKVGVVEDTTIAARGDLFIRPRNMKQKEALLSLKELGGMKVTCTLTRTESEDRAVIYKVPLDLTDEEIADHLKAQGVKEAKRRKRMTEEYVETDSEVVTLVFASTNVPKKVKMLHQTYVVHPFLPSPRLCYNCFGWGHFQDECKNEPRCRRCSGPHPSDPTCSEPRCCPCCKRSDHIAGTRRCPVFKERQENIKTSMEKGISIQDAAKRGARLATTPPRKSQWIRSAPSQVGGEQSEENRHNLDAEIIRLKRRLETLEGAPGSSDISQNPSIVALQEQLDKVKNEVKSISDTVDPMKVTLEEINSALGNMEETRKKEKTEEEERRKKDEERWSQLMTLMEEVKQSNQASKRNRSPSNTPHGMTNKIQEQRQLTSRYSLSPLRHRDQETDHRAEPNGQQQQMNRKPWSNSTTKPTTQPPFSKWRPKPVPSKSLR